MDASKEIRELTEVIALYTAIATFGSGWKQASAEDLDHRAQELGHRVADALRHREGERAMYD